MSPSSKASKKPAVALTKVPSVRVLCESLGFQKASLKDTNNFMDATHAWRKAFKTDGGTPGPELLLWNQPFVQSDLTTMAEKFLEDRGNGDQFWSPTRSWNDDSQVQYPEDRARIIELLKQLFWRQNRYAANNNAYAQKIIERRDTSQEKTTPVHHTAEITGKISPTMISLEGDNQNQQEARNGSWWSPSPSLDAGHAGNGLAAKVYTHYHVTIPDQGVRPSVETDIFEVPDDDNENTTTKVPEVSTPGSKSRKGPSRDTPRRKRKKYSLDEPPRRTDRKAIPVSRPGIVPYVSDELYEQFMKTPSPPATPPLIQDRNQQRSKEIVGSPHSISKAKQKIVFRPEVLPAQSPTSKRFTAPTAPMLFSSHAEGSEKGLRTLKESTQDVSPSESVPKSDTDTGSPRNQSSKIARLKMKGAQTSRPEPASEVASDPAQIYSQPPNRPTSSGPSRDKGLQPPEASENFLETPYRTDQNSLDSAIGSDGSSARAASKSKGIDEAFRPSNTPQPVHGVKRSTPSDRDTPKASSSDKRIKKMEATDTKMVDRGPNHLEPVHPHQMGRSLSAENASSKPRTKTQVPLWIITREPRYTEERWDDGKFQGTKLSDFLEDLSKATKRKHIEKVKLTLRTPNFDTKITVLNDAEDSWISAKGKFVEKLKEARAEAKANRPNETPSLDILVEPFYEGGAMMTSNADDDDEEFDF